MRISLSNENFKTLVSGGIIQVPNADGSQVHEIALQDIGWDAMFLGVACSMADTPASDHKMVAAVLESTASKLRELGENQDE